MSLGISTEELRKRAPRDPELTRAMEKLAQSMDGGRNDEVLRMIAQAIAQSKPADLGPALSALAQAIAALKPAAYEFEVTEFFTSGVRAGRIKKWVARPLKK